MTVVEPIGDDERAAFSRRVRIGVTLLVGLSAGLVTSQGDPSLPEVAGAVAVGLVVGYALARYVVPSGPAPATQQRRRRERRENPFADGGGERSTDDEDRTETNEPSSRRK